MEKRPRRECVSLSDFTIIELQTPNTLTRPKNQRTRLLRAGTRTL